MTKEKDFKMRIENANYSLVNKDYSHALKELRFAGDILLEEINKEQKRLQSREDNKKEETSCPF